MASLNQRHRRAVEQLDWIVYLEAVMEKESHNPFAVGFYSDLLREAIQELDKIVLGVETK